MENKIIRQPWDRAPVYVHLFKDDADDTHTHAQRVGEKREFTRKTYRLAGQRNATDL